MGTFVVYTRVSTERQGEHGLGMAAQLESCRDHVKRIKGTIVKEFAEVASGTEFSVRPVFKEALDLAQEEGHTLLAHDLDRLGRSVYELFGLRRRKVRFTTVVNGDMNTLHLSLLAGFAEHEAERISDRTKRGLAQARARGVRLGAPPENLKLATQAAAKKAKERARPHRVRVLAIMERQRGRRVGFAAIAEELNVYGVLTPSGLEWTEKSATRYYNLYKATRGL